MNELKAKQVSVGDYIEIIDISDINYGKSFYIIKCNNGVFWYGKEPNKNILQQQLWIGFYYEYFFKIIRHWTPNRQYLSDFLKLNNIKKTLVSKYLGMAENWLTTMVNEKRSNRKDISDSTLNEIMRKLHIDWTSQEFINVKATKSNTAYKTKPCNYSRVVDKERLQRSMWNGELVA
jgi:hypothetical protein